MQQLRYFLLAILIGLLTTVTAVTQNLVPNPGFEEYTELPNFSAEFGKVREWFNPAGEVPAKSEFGTPDYFHVDGGPSVRIPDTRMGKVSAFRGYAVAGLILYNKYDEGLVDFREYLCVALTEPMQVGQVYKVQFHYSTGSGNHYGKYTTPNLQLSFTEEEPVQKGHKPLFLEPHYASPEFKSNPDWEKISFEFTADRPYQFLTIGNFERDKDTQLETVYMENGAGPCAYYFIDEVSVVGAGALELTCPPDVALATDPGLCDKSVKYTLPEVDGPKGTDLVLVEGLESGERFGKGETVVMYRATSPDGATAECEFRVVVRDEEPPVIDCPEDMVVAPAANARRTVVDYPLATATDNCGAVKVLRIEGPTGKAGFLKGTTTVTFRAVDRANNGSDCSFSVTVTVTEESDDVIADVTENPVVVETPEPPVTVEVPETPETPQPPAIATPPLQLKCPPNITARTDPGRCDKAVSYPRPEWTGPEGTKFGRVSGGASKEKFPVGEHTIRYRVESPSGEELECDFNIRVADYEPPSIKCPVDMQVKAGPGEKAKQVDYPEIIASDNCNRVTPKLVTGLKSGAKFPLGQTLLKYTATDAANNQSECSFRVQVDGLPEKIGEETVAFQEEVIATSSASITIYFYDAQVRDNDIISINVDGEWVLKESKIKKKKGDFWKTDHISVTLQPDQLHYMVFQAIDEGSIPPCTISLMIVDEARNLIAERTVAFKIGESGGVVFQLR